MQILLDFRLSVLFVGFKFVSYSFCSQGISLAATWSSANSGTWCVISVKEMSHLTNESEDGVLSKDQTGSPLIDEGNSSGSAGGGIVLKKGPWTSSEDAILVEYVKKHGEGNWNAVQKHSGLFRCGKSCRLRWANHLRPNLKKGAFTADEERLIIELHAKMGNKWARMAAHVRILFTSIQYYVIVHLFLSLILFNANSPANI